MVVLLLEGSANADHDADIAAAGEGVAAVVVSAEAAAVVGVSAAVVVGVSTAAVVGVSAAAVVGVSAAELRLRVYQLRLRRRRRRLWRCKRHRCPRTWRLNLTGEKKTIIKSCTVVEKRKYVCIRSRFT